jgi:hypothetical protein
MGKVYLADNFRLAKLGKDFRNQVTVNQISADMAAEILNGTIIVNEFDSCKTLLRHTPLGPECVAKWQQDPIKLVPGDTLVAIETIQNQETLEFENFFYLIEMGE